MGMFFNTFLHSSTSPKQLFHFDIYELGNMILNMNKNEPKYPLWGGGGGGGLNQNGTLIGGCARFGGCTGVGFMLFQWENFHKVGLKHVEGGGVAKLCVSRHVV